jgi:hypothetical protein
MMLSLNLLSILDSSTTVRDGAYSAVQSDYAYTETVRNPERTVYISLKTSGASEAVEQPETRSVDTDFF